MVRLADKWMREGRKLIRLAEAEPQVVGDAALRGAGGARLACAKQLRAEIRKQRSHA